MKFLADEMNGDLARWLRILGYDCEYGGSDHELIVKAEMENRVLLTGDKELYRMALRTGLQVVYTNPCERVEGKLRTVLRETKIAPFAFPSRCPLCNGDLAEVGEEEIAKEVPPKVLEKRPKFYRCRRCGHVYWVGSHWRSITSLTKRVLREIGCEERR